MVKGGKKAVTKQSNPSMTKNPINAPSISSSDSTSTSTKGIKRKSQDDGLAEIDNLFSNKKTEEKEIKKQKREEAQQEEEERKRRKAMKRSTNLNANSVAALQGKTCKTISLHQDRSDTEKIRSGEWANDGLGGIFDSEGYTGRREGGVKVFKAHLFNKKGFGTTKDCPFDCSCCYI